MTGHPIDSTVEAFLLAHPDWSRENRHRYLSVLGAFADAFDNVMPGDPQAVIEWIRELEPVSPSKGSLATSTRRDYFKRFRTFWAWHIAASENGREPQAFTEPFENFGPKRRSYRPPRI